MGRCAEHPATVAIVFGLPERNPVCLRNVRGFSVLYCDYRPEPLLERCDMKTSSRLIPVDELHSHLRSGQEQAALRFRS
jgi:hypothetical protein